MIKKLLPFIFLCFVAFELQAQNCTKTSVGYPPINDLGTAYWRSFQGGLYPNGSNYRPAAHNNAGLTIANSISPLDTNGNVDMTNGKIVWLSVGMSNTTQESQVFIPMADTLSGKNPKLVLVDGAQGGQDITIIDDPNAPFWNNINNRLANAGVRAKQVQAVWFKEAEANPHDTALATYPDSLKIKFRIAIQILKNKFPNTKLCYLSNRIYAGYATSTLNPEPYAYYAGWSVKRLIEDQINGDTSLIYTGASPRAPWLAWGPNLWADGTTPRSDGLTWVCPTDYVSDGTHPATAGRQKVAGLLRNFFTSDSTTTPWFLKSLPTGLQNNSPATTPTIFPNPASDQITITGIQQSTGAHTFRIYDLTGRIIFESICTQSSETIDCKRFSGGIYFVLIKNSTTVFSEKIVIQK